MSNKWQRAGKTTAKGEPRPTIPGGTLRPEPAPQPTAVELLRLAGERAMRAYPAVAPKRKQEGSE